MVLNLGAFYQGVQENDARERAKRKENAALYNEFIRLNPDASVKQREAYASELGGNSPFLRAAMPTTEVMASNVARRKQQVAAAAQAKKYKALQQKIGLMNDATQMFSNVYSSTGDLDQAKTAVTDMFSGYLDGNDMLGISAAGTKKAQQDFDKDFATTYDLWEKQGSQASAVETWQKTYNPNFLKKWIPVAQSRLNSLEKQQYNQALKEANETGTSAAADPSVRDNFEKIFDSKYDRLNQEQKAEVLKILDAKKVEEEGNIADSIKQAKQQVINKTIETKTTDQNYPDQMNVVNLQTDAAIKDYIKTQFNLNPLLVGVEPTEEDINDIKKAVEESLKVKAKLDEATEAKQFQKSLTEQEVGRFSPRFEDKDGNLDVKQQNAVEDEMLAQLFPEVDNDDKENEAAKELAKNQFLNNFRVASENWDISIKDPAVYGSIMQRMVDLIMNDNSGADGTFQDYFFIQAVNDYYSNTSLNTPEAIAFRNALKAQGIGGLDDAQKLIEEGNAGVQLEWAETFKKARADIREAAYKNFDKDIHNLQTLDDEAGDFFNDLESRIETAVTNDGVKIKDGVSDLLEAEITPDNLKALELKNSELTGSLRKVVNIGREIEDQISQIDAYLELPRFSLDPSLKDTRTSLIEKRNKLNAAKRFALSEATLLQNEIMKIRSSSNQRVETKVIDNGNLNPENIPDAVKDKATTISYILKKNAETSGLNDVHNLKTSEERKEWIKDKLRTVGGEDISGMIGRIFTDTSTEDALIRSVAEQLNIDIDTPSWSTGSQGRNKGRNNRQ